MSSGAAANPQNYFNNDCLIKLVSIRQSHKFNVSHRKRRKVAGDPLFCFPHHINFIWVHIKIALSVQDYSAEKHTQEQERGHTQCHECYSDEAVFQFEQSLRGLLSWTTLSTKLNPNVVPGRIANDSSFDAHFIQLQKQNDLISWNKIAQSLFCYSFADICETLLVIWRVYHAWSCFVAVCCGWTTDQSKVRMLHFVPGLVTALPDVYTKSVMFAGLLDSFLLEWAEYPRAPLMPSHGLEGKLENVDMY